MAAGIKLFIPIRRNLLVATFIVIFGCFTTSVNSVTFECEFKKAGAPIVVLGDVYLCQPQVILAEDESGVLENVLGDHMESKTHDDVGMLNVYQQKLSFIPIDIPDFFPNLRGINWHDSDLAELSAEDLKPFPQLLYLGVRFTQLKTVVSDLFEHTPNLQYITFAGSQIHHVGENLVTHLKDLKILDFQLNKCIHRIAKTPEQVAKMNEDLPNECPPWFKADEPDIEGGSGDFYDFEGRDEL